MWVFYEKGEETKLDLRKGPTNDTTPGRSVGKQRLCLEAQVQKEGETKT